MAFRGKIIKSGKKRGNIKEKRKGRCVRKKRKERIKLMQNGGK
jgi:hypothetical protein